MSSAQTDPSRPLVVWQAGVAWDGVTGTDWHLVNHLSRHVDVLWVDPPVSIVTPLRARQRPALRPRLDVVAPRITRLRCSAPPFAFRPGLDRITVALARAAIRSSLGHLEQVPEAVVSTSPLPALDVVARARRIYFATDDFSAGAELMGKRARRFQQIEQRRVREADVLGAVSPEIVARWAPVEQPTFVLPNGCDVQHFAGVETAPLPTDVSLPRPIIGLVGQLTPRIDLSLLEAVADAGMSLLLVGPRQVDFEPQRVRRLLERANVVAVGQKRFEELPSYLRMIDVGLTPYTGDAFNLASFPLKTLEYLSAGRPVVSTPLPAVERLAAPGVRTAATPDEFVTAVRSTLAAQVAHPGASEELRSFARRHDWSARAATFLADTGLDRDLPGVRGAGR
ncbi:glycosyltransferase family 1 protein [Nocardioides sp. JQ2195]|uniref:glycosyltransferase n=1 Tax=Nocardioides sp. JQ2195 TaxID=2592334 RepID=UPI00143EA08D|nr:glycosyltransferase [Nocardioides sp. JQ2195]QIX27858.1 glycosyltransferase family 1 protein [Nocardioides sp. JQ2195]